MLLLSFVAVTVVSLVIDPQQAKPEPADSNKPVTTTLVQAMPRSEQQRIAGEWADVAAQLGVRASHSLKDALREPLELWKQRKPHSAGKSAKDAPVTATLMAALTGSDSAREGTVREVVATAKALGVPPGDGMADAARTLAAQAQRHRDAAEANRARVQQAAQAMGVGETADLAAAARELRRHAEDSRTAQTPTTAELQQIARLLQVPADSNLAKAVADRLRQAEDAARAAQARISQLESARTAASSDRRGFGPLPCWESAPNQPEFLYTISHHSGTFRIEPAWPSNRRAELDRLPAFTALAGRALSASQFEADAVPIYTHSRANQCRYFVNFVLGPGGTVDGLEVVERYFYVRRIKR
jgi:hypothetical protein